VPPLIAFRDCSDPGVDDLMWPVVTEDLLIRLEPGEVTRWRGTATVAEVRQVGQADDKWELVWRLTEPADVLITDRRITYRGYDFRKGTGQIAAEVAALGRPCTTAAPSVLAGQVRFQWAAAIRLARVRGRSMWAVICAGQDGEAPVRLMLGIDEKTTGAAAESIAEDVAAGLASDIARFRLIARARTLKPADVGQLTAQRDHPAPALSNDGSTRTWLLPGALKIGGGADIRPRKNPLYREALATLEQYQATGDVTLLDKSLQLAEVLLEDQSASARSELIHLNFLAGGLKLRYARLGDLNDLARCIEAQRKVAERVASEAPDLAAGCFHNLGGALVERFKRTLDRRDLTDGVAAHEQAVAATDRDSADWADHLSGLAQALKTRYITTRDANDLDQAITIFDQTLSAMPPDSQDVPGGLVNLSNALTMRYEHGGGDRNDLSRAVSAGQRAVRLMSRKSIHHATALLSLALCMGKLYEADGEPAHLQAAVDAWREGCQRAHDLLPSAALQGAVNWAMAMIRCRDWAAAVEACDIGLSTADSLYQLQLTGENQAVYLDEASPLPGLAAYAFGKLGRLREAAAVIEHGRAVAFSEALSRDEAVLDRLPDIGFGSLRDEYHQAVEQLTQVQRASPDAAGFTGFVYTRLRDAAWRSARADLDRVIDAIRDLPDYESFLAAPPSYADVASAATGTCLAYVTATRLGGFALLVDGRASSEPELSIIWLDELTETVVQDMYKEFRARFYPAFMSNTDQQYRTSFDSMTRRLWDLAIGPIVARVSDGPLALIPGGRLLDLLPLHAAWTEDPSATAGRRYALEAALVAYAPSARVLNEVSQRVGRPASDILAVFDPDLPNSEVEAQDARGQFDDGEVLRKDRVTRRSLQDMLPRHSVLHFSCHGLANLTRPLESRLGAACDEPLTLRDILDTTLSARLCVLSACESAIPGGSVPNQAISLPGGLLQAGAAGVVGSLWPVADIYARVLLTRFYQLWKGDGLEPAEALRQAQLWMRDQAVHAAHWAAFVYVGA
jgi:CHAT domain-containing protein/tetratricopeptide (TPR) repeat protein